LWFFLLNNLQPTKSIYIGLNLNRPYILGLEPEMPVTIVMPQEAVDLCHMYLISTGQSRFRLPFAGASQNCGKRLLTSSCLSVRLSVNMEELGSRWTNFHEILLFGYFSKNLS
jgi:uncharacterized protein (DUF169 family)